MKSRERFVKGEIRLIKKILDVSYDYCQHSYALDIEERFEKIIKLIFEINEMVITLKKRIKGSI